MRTGERLSKGFVGTQEGEREEDRRKRERENGEIREG